MSELFIVPKKQELERRRAVTTISLSHAQRLAMMEYQVRELECGEKKSSFSAIIGSALDEFLRVKGL